MEYPGLDCRLRPNLNARVSKARLSGVEDYDLIQEVTRFSVETTKSKNSGISDHFLVEKNAIRPSNRTIKTGNAVNASVTT